MKNLAVFASGTGTNFSAIAKACASGELAARVAVLVCDKPGAPVIERAKEMGVETFVFTPKAYASKADYEAEIVRILDAKGIDLVCLAGYMRIVGEPSSMHTTARSSTFTLPCCPPSKAPMPWKKPWPTASKCMASPSTG